MRTIYETDRFEIIDRTDETQEDMKREVLRGLTARQKWIPSRYFYDSRGSALFEQICRLPEYYQARTEMSLLRENANSIMDGMHDADFIDLGSGANWKIRHLLDAADGRRGGIRYVPVDVCEAAIIGAAEELLSLYSNLRVSGIVGDFGQAVSGMEHGRRKLITMFGGTIGNFREEDAPHFLTRIGGRMTREDRLLVGLDLVKDKEIIEAAYNDDQGVTAEFNRNILAVVNRMFNANFAPSMFDHVAFFNGMTQSVEMHLRAQKDAVVEIADLSFEISITAGETIFTEVSRKFTRETADRMTGGVGLRISRWFTDPKAWFALAEMRTG